MASTSTDLGSLFQQFKASLDQLLKGQLSIRFALTIKQKLVVAVFFALLLGIVIGLVFNRIGQPRLPIFALILIVFAVIIYFVL